MRKHKSQKSLSIESWSAYINTRPPSKSQNNRVDTKYKRKYKYLNIGRHAIGYYKNFHEDTADTVKFPVGSLKILKNNISVTQTLSENREKRENTFQYYPDTKIWQKYHLPKHNQIYPYDSCTKIQLKYFKVGSYFNYKLN